MGTRKGLPPGYGPAGRKWRWGFSRQCYWCGGAVSYGGSPRPTQATRDHLIPLSLMSRSEQEPSGVELQVVACRRCNIFRGNSMDWVPFHLQYDGITLGTKQPEPERRRIS